MTEVRVRLVFADDVGRHVQRRRGFSSCWYLVPRDAKLVGDLAHLLLREFELRKRCPKGLELQLEELPLLATQSIRIVRDNDAIVVQCPPLGDTDDSETSFSESEAETPKQRKQRKRKLRVKKTEQRPKMKIARTVKSVVNGVSSVNAQTRGKSATKLKESSKVESLSSSSSSSSESESSSSSGSSSSSDNSSESSSSSSESEGESVPQYKPKRTTSDVSTNKQQLGKPNGTASAKAPNGIASKEIVPEQSGKEPRRRRRRLRQRNGGRARNGKKANVAENAASQLPSPGNDAALNGQGSMTTAPEQTNQASLGTQNSGSMAGPRGYPRAKAHVLFDDVTGDQVDVQQDKNFRGTRGEDWATRRYRAPELAKYGPSFLGNKRSGAPRDAQNQTVNGHTDRDQNINDDNNAIKRNEKGKYEERWKRPYEIVATVLDKKAERSSENTSPAPDLAKLLASYPAASAGSSSFEPKDVIAFKTLTLCLETWQPVVSDWKCGQVQSVDGNSIEVSNWTLRANGDSVDFHETPSGEQYTVQISEISELWFLSGPSHSSLVA